MKKRALRKMEISMRLLLELLCYYWGATTNTGAPYIFKQERRRVTPLVTSEWL